MPVIRVEMYKGRSVDQKRAILGQPPFAALHGGFHQGCGFQVPVKLCAGLDALIVQAEVRNPVGQLKIPFVQ